MTSPNGRRKGRLMSSWTLGSEFSELSDWIYRLMDYEIGKAK